MHMVPRVVESGKKIVARNDEYVAGFEPFV